MDKKKKILVVDDEVDFLEMMKARLEANGYEVISANNGKEALERVRNDNPDALLLDIMMPEIDGLAVLKEVRAKDARLPVFLITAFSNEDRLRIASTFNASGFIDKTGDLGIEVKNMASVIEIAQQHKRPKKP